MSDHIPVGDFFRADDYLQLCEPWTDSNILADKSPTGKT